MSPSKESVWGRWLPHPGNLLTQQGSGGMLLAVVGTRAALEESVRCVRAMAYLTVAAVGLMAVAPLAAWLVSWMG